MTPGEELASLYDEVADLTATTDMSGALQPQFISRMLGVAPADVVALHDLRHRLDADPDDLELAAEAERSLGAVRELRTAAHDYAAREVERSEAAPEAVGTVAAAGGGRTAAEADELECLAFADTVDWLLEETGVAELPPADRVDALAHALRTPRDRIRAVIDAHAEVGDPDVGPARAVTAVRAARPVLDRLVDRVEHGDVHPLRPAAGTTAGTTTDPGGTGSARQTAGGEPPELDELTRLAREQADLPAAGGAGRWLLIVLIVLVVIVVVFGAVLVAG